MYVDIYIYSFVSFLLLTAYFLCICAYRQIRLSVGTTRYDVGILFSEKKMRACSKIGVVTVHRGQYIGVRAERTLLEVQVCTTITFVGEVRLTHATD
jgi:hypothetical protein